MCGNNRNKSAFPSDGHGDARHPGYLPHIAPGGRSMHPYPLARRPASAGGKDPVMPKQTICRLLDQGDPFRTTYGIMGNHCLWVFAWESFSQGFLGGGAGFLPQHQGGLS